MMKMKMKMKMKHLAVYQRMGYNWLPILCLVTTAISNEVSLAPLAQIPATMSTMNLQSVNKQISQYYQRNHPYVPTPVIHRVIEPCDVTQLADVASVAMQAWELCHTGLNGLRYGTYHESENMIENVSLEKCRSNQEDLSSFEEYLGNKKDSHAARRSYWFTRVFNNCATICVCLQTAFNILKSSVKGKSLSHNGLSFKVDSVEMKGFSIMKRDGFESCTLTNEDMTRYTNNFHRIGEGQNHVIMTIRSQDDEEYVLDLSGPQFGNFGPNPLQPYLCVEPIELWKTRYLVCIPSPKSMSYDAKTAMAKEISSIVCKAYFVNSATNQRKTTKPNPTVAIEEGAEERARLAEAELLGMLENEASAGAKEKGSRKKK